VTKQEKPVLRVIAPDATDEEVAAIIAAIAECTRAVEVPAEAPDTLHEWTRASRLTARRAGMQRGPWRLSGRVGRRSRA
jgi:2-keto-3-deoxy-6-phosphogluconate aldolase